MKVQEEVQGQERKEKKIVITDPRFQTSCVMKFY